METSASQVGQGDALDQAGYRWGIASIRCHQTAAKIVGLNLTDWLALEVLEHSGPAPVTELAKHLGLSCPGATSLLDRLELGGLVERRSDPDDRRRVVAHLTGVRIGSDAMAADLGAALINHAAGFTESQQELILKFVRGASEVLETVTARHAERHAELSKRRRRGP